MILSRFHALHERAVRAANSYLNSEKDLIEVLGLIDQKRAYRDFGCKSLFDYATRKLFLTESTAYTLIMLARKSLEIPVLREKIKNQEIFITNARLIAPVLKPDNQKEWLAKAESFSKREL